MNKYLLAHGFGFDNNYWKNLIPLLKGEIYFLDDPNLDAAETYIGIGHSLGFLKLNNSNLKFKALIALQGFLNYCGSTSVLRKVREKRLEDITNNIKKDKMETLESFRLFCGYNEHLTVNFELSELLNDLDLMKHSYKHCGVKTLVIGSVDDRIVPMSIINDNFSSLPNVSIIQCDDGRHSLGYNKPEYIVEKINEFCC